MSLLYLRPSIASAIRWDRAMAGFKPATSPSLTLLWSTRPGGSPGARGFSPRGTTSITGLTVATIQVHPLPTRLGPATWASQYIIVFKVVYGCTFC